MNKPKLNSKLGSAAMVAASLVVAGTIATASAAPDSAPTSNSPTSGYTAQQCKDGGWRNFKNPDGSQKFKNQGQCVAFFTAHHNPGHNVFAALWNLILGFFSWFGSFFNGLLNLLQI